LVSALVNIFAIIARVISANTSSAPSAAPAGCWAARRGRAPAWGWSAPRCGGRRRDSASPCPN